MINAAYEVPEVTITVDIQRMRLSDGRCDYFVRIDCDGRSVTPHVFRERYKAEYEVAHWKHIFFNEPKPDIMAYDEESHPND